MTSKIKLMPADVDRVMERENDKARHFRDADRPRFGLKIRRQPKALEDKRREGRVRTATWRNRNDETGRPESSDIARALLVALVMSPDLEERLAHEDLFLVTVALEMLELNGFSRAATKDAISRFRRSFVAGKSQMREAQDVRMQAFDTYVERAASRAESEGFR